MDQPALVGAYETTAGGGIHAISSKPLDRLFYKLRSKYGTVLMPATDVKRSFIAWSRKLHCLALVADQKPAEVQVPATGSIFWQTYSFIYRAR